MRYTLAKASAHAAGLAGGTYGAASSFGGKGQGTKGLLKLAEADA